MLRLDAGSVVPAGRDRIDAVLGEKTQLLRILWRRAGSQCGRRMGRQAQMCQDFFGNLGRLNQGHKPPPAAAAIAVQYVDREDPP